MSQTVIDWVVAGSQIFNLSALVTGGFLLTQKRGTGIRHPKRLRAGLFFVGGCTLLAMVSLLVYGPRPVGNGVFWQFINVSSVLLTVLLARAAYEFLRTRRGQGGQGGIEGVGGVRVPVSPNSPVRTGREANALPNEELRVQNVRR